MGQNPKLKKDIIFALLTVLVCAASCLWAYPQVLAYEQAPTQFLFTLKPGQSALAIRDDKGCVALLETNLSHNEVFSLRMNGTVRISFQGKQIEPKIILNARFNALGQLNQSALSISSNELALRLLTKGVNPIQVDLVGRGKLAKSPKKMNLPGPLKLTKLYQDSADSSYGLYYAGWMKGINLNTPEFLLNLIQFSQLPQLQLTHNVAECAGAPSSTLNLDALANMQKLLDIGPSALSLKES